MGKTIKHWVKGLFAMPRKLKVQETPNKQIIVDRVQYRVRLGNGSDGRYCLWFRTRSAARLYKKALLTDNPRATVQIFRREYTAGGYILDDSEIR